MSATFVLIKYIRQKNNHTFTIKWSDDIVQDYELSNLQKHCPCAKCDDIYKKQRTVDLNKINPDVQAINITNVGRYALRVKFTEGCSTGIYNYALLREIGSPSNEEAHV